MLDCQAALSERSKVLALASGCAPSLEVFDAVGKVETMSVNHKVPTRTSFSNTSCAFFSSSPPAALFLCLPDMTVGTSNNTFADFFLNGLNRIAFLGHIRDLFSLEAPHMIKLQNDGVALSTIDARMTGKKIPDIFARDVTEPLLALPGVGYVSLSVSLVPAVLLFLLAASTRGLLNALISIAPVEFIDWFFFPAMITDGRLHLHSL